MTDKERVKDAESQFSKKELLRVADLLELKVDIGARARDIIKAILDDISKNGVPEAGADELLDSFLFVTEFIDDKGNLLEDKQQPAVKQPETKLPDQLPECYGYQSDRDPACIRCKLQEACKEARMKKRPECFGVLFDKNAAECIACLEAVDCKLSFERK